MTILPNVDEAIIPIEKFTKYALDPRHPVGKNKAIVFEGDFNEARNVSKC